MAIQKIRDFIQDGLVKEFSQPGSNYRFDQEGTSVNYPRLLPAHFYTFIPLREVGPDSVPSLDEWQTGLSGGKKPYYDNRPIFISLGQEGPMEIGLNVKLLPTLVRKKFIRTYLKSLMPSLEKMVDDKGEFIKLEERARLSAMNSLLRVNRDYIRSASGLSGLNFEFLVDKYNRAEMRYLKLIDWPDVPKLGEVNYSQDKTIASRTPISYFLTKFT